MKNKPVILLSPSALMWLKGRNVEDLKLKEIRNLGPFSQNLLAGIGIQSWLELKKRGWKQCYLDIVEKNPKKANAILAYALAAAESCSDWRELTKVEKTEILDFHKETKKKTIKYQHPKRSI